MASAKPMAGMIALSEKMNPPKTETMMIAAAVTTDRPARTPSDDGRPGRRAVDVCLPHPGGEEEHVVHREAEQDADQDGWQEVQDRAGRVDSEDPAQPPHWKIATTAPKAANSDRMNPPVAINGTKIDRKTTTMMSSDSPTTSAR